MATEKPDGKIGSTDRLPPSNRDAEKAILGNCLKDSRQIPDAMRVLRTEDFYVYAHQLIFAAMVTLADKGKRADVVTVAELLSKQKQLADVGGPSYMAELMTGTSSAS